MMTAGEASTKLAALGVRRGFSPIIEAETGTVLLKVRRAVRIEGGALEGCEIVLSAGGFLVWTAQSRTARKLAALHGVKVRLLNGEAELTIPGALADEILPKLGARVRREVPEAQRRALRARLGEARNVQNNPEIFPEERSSRGVTPQKRPRGHQIGKSNPGAI